MKNNIPIIWIIEENWKSEILTKLLGINNKTKKPEINQILYTRFNLCIFTTRDNIPNGKIIAGPLEAEEGILYADINLQDIIKAKRMFDVVGHYARPDVFSFQVKRPEKK